MNATSKKAKSTRKRSKAPSAGSGPKLLSGGNPQIPKGDGEAPVQAFLRGTALRPLPPVESKDPNVRYLHIHEDEPLDEERFVSWTAQAANTTAEKFSMRPGSCERGAWAMNSMRPPARG